MAPYGVSDGVLTVGFVEERISTVITLSELLREDVVTVDVVMVDDSIVVMVVAMLSVVVVVIGSVVVGRVRLVVEDSGARWDETIMMQDKEARYER